MPYFVNITKRLFTQTKFAGVKDFQSNTILPQQKSFAYSTYTMKLYIDFVRWQKLYSEISYSS